MPVRKISGLLYSLSFYLNDIVFPTLGMITNRRIANGNTDNVLLTGTDTKKVGLLKNKNLLYFDPINFLQAYSRVQHSFNIPPGQIFDTTYNIVTPLPLGTTSTLNYRNGVIELENVGGGLTSLTQVELEYTAKDYIFLTTWPEENNFVEPVIFCLELEDQSGKPFAIGSDADFYRCSFTLSFAARSDVEVIEICDIVRRSVRVNIPIIDFETLGVWPVYQNGEPNPDFIDFAETDRWLDIKTVSARSIPGSKVPGLSLHQGSARIISELVY